MENQLLSSMVLDIRNIMETAHRNVAQEVNNELIVAYWKIGEIIVRYEQNDNIRAAYGKQTLKQLSKTLTAEFELVVGQEKLSYEIQDEANSQYLELNITNTLTYYLVDEAFDTYKIGDKITNDTYMSLIDEQKAKCHSSAPTKLWNDIFYSTIQTESTNYHDILPLSF